MDNKDLNSNHKALEELNRKVNTAIEARKTVSGSPKIDPNGMSLAMRMASEFVSAIVVGSILGFGLDNWLGTKPVWLLIGLGLGFTTGVVNIVRTAREYAKDKPIGQDLPPSTDDED